MKILPFPELRQAYTYDCGAIVAEAILEYYGLDVREGIILKIAKTTRAGTPPRKIIKIFEKYGLKCKAGEFAIKELKKFIDKKIPVILLVQAWTFNKKVNWEKDWKDGHYVVAIGYDKKKIYFEDPVSLMRTYLNYNELDKRWHDTDAKGKKYIHYGIAVFGKRPKFNPKKKIHMR
jgi:ABC-type bacteriocin/lantibiotic exporter with double-glycine peptidase domain